MIASRAALSEFCAASAANLHAVCTCLVANLKACQGRDRVVVPTLEVVAFLFHVGLFQRCGGVDLRQLCLRVQTAAYKTGNVRKLEACVRVYGCIAALGQVDPGSDGDTSKGEQALGAPDGSEGNSNRAEGIAEARKRLGALLFHPWPRVRTFVVDELWGLLADREEVATKLTGVDWGKAEKGTVKAMIGELGLA